MCMLDLLCAIFCLLSIIICIYLQVAYGVVGWGIYMESTDGETVYD